MRWYRVCGVLGVLFSGSVTLACGPVVSIDTASSGTSGAGGHGGGTASQGGAGATTAQGGGGSTDTEDCLCFDSSNDCGGDPGECRAWACDAAACCVAVLVPDGTPDPTQIEGDCQQYVCQAGMIVAATDDSDIPDDADDCTIDACIAGQPTYMPAPRGTPCASGAVCDGAGSCVECNVDADCMGPQMSCEPVIHECIIVDCWDGVKDGQETDVDCGGPNSCGPCADGQTCNTAADCQSQICAASICMASTCVDAVANGAETDVDCGGPACDPCATGKGCILDADCQSGMCAGVVCQ